MKKRILCLALSLHSLGVASTLKPWFLIFLDIDGVLFHQSLVTDLSDKRRQKVLELFGSTAYDPIQYGIATAYFLDNNAVALFEGFIDQMAVSHQVGIVLSSAWREGVSLDVLRDQIFAPWRFAQFFIDKTVDGDSYYHATEEKPSALAFKKYGLILSSRADQIDYWLKEHSDMDIANFIILDDIDFEFSEKFPTHFVQTHGFLLSRADILEASMKGATRQAAPLMHPDTPVTRINTTLEIALHYASYLKTTFSPEQTHRFTKALQENLNAELTRRSCARLYPNYSELLAKAFRNADLSPLIDLFPQNAFSYIECENGYLKIYMSPEIKLPLQINESTGLCPRDALENPWRIQ